MRFSSFGFVKVLQGVVTFFHPGWNQGKYARSLGNDDDVALIRLNKNSNKKPMKRYPKNPRVGQNLEFIGLGRTTSAGSFTNELQIQQIEVVQKSKCQEVYTRGFESGLLCAGGNDDGFCEGDEGGPLFLTISGNDKLVGIAHLKDPKFECGEVPTLYTKTSRFEGWIKEKIRSN